jgi:hypothetical protein
MFLGRVVASRSRVNMSVNRLDYVGHATTCRCLVDNVGAMQHEHKYEMMGLYKWPNDRVEAQISTKKGPIFILDALCLQPRISAAPPSTIHG